MSATTLGANNGPAGFRPAPRVLTSVLAPLEKRCLTWLAARMPSRVNPDHLTLVGLAAMAAAGACYWAAAWHRWALAGAIVALALNWFGDSLDGTLARVRNQQRPRYGFYVDHVLDAVGLSLLVTGMALSGLMAPVVALALLVAYLLVCVEEYLATYTIGRFTITRWQMGPTELRILLAVGTAWAIARPEVTIAGRSWLLFDAGAVVAIAALAASLITSIVTNTRTLYRAEPLPGRHDSGREPRS